MSFLTKTVQERKKIRSDFFYRMMFRLYFHSDSFHHLNQTVDVLLSRIFVSPSLAHQTTYHYYVDVEVANASTEYRLGKLQNDVKDSLENAITQDSWCSHFKNLEEIKNALYFAKYNKIASKIPWYLAA